MTHLGYSNTGNKRAAVRLMPWRQGRTCWCYNDGFDPVAPKSLDVRINSQQHHRSENYEHDYKSACGNSRGWRLFVRRFRCFHASNIDDDSARAKAVSLIAGPLLHP
jgi:hypothetical protein